MSNDIQNLISMLKSEETKERLKACKLLGEFQELLPEEAFDALRLARNDKNIRVSEAAQRSLATQVSRKEAQATRKETQAIPFSKFSTASIMSMIGFAILGGVILPFVSICLIANLTMGMGESLAFASMIPSSIIGIFVGGRWGYTRSIRK